LRKPPVISVIIPAHNEQRFLGAALASLSRQTYADFEVLVIDNGSTDATGQIIDEWSSRDARVHGLTLQTASLSRSLQEGVAQSRGTFIARLDADDIAAPERLRRQYEAMVREPELGLLGSAAQLITESGKACGLTTPPLTDHEIRLAMPTECPFVHSSVMMRRDAYLRAGGYRPGLNLAEDYDLWLRMMLVAKVANLPEALVKYRKRSDSLTVRRHVQLAMASLCVSAAAVARQTDIPEPFAQGTPVLRQALPLLGVKRSEVRAAIRREAILKWYVRLRLPSLLNEGLRRALIACGLKPLILHLLMPLARLRAASATFAERSHVARPARIPFVTVAVCTRDRPVQLHSFLTSACLLDIPDDVQWELLIVDNGTDERSAETAERFAHLLPLRRIKAPVPGLSRARNFAVDEARGDLICWADDDVVLDRHWLAAYVSAFQRQPDAAVFGGRILAELEEPVPLWVRKCLGRSQLGCAFAHPS
jgi:glycosyltransferase involved in cell wall biosynthesis